ncbi:hypothetical protein BDZ89DRAFT_1074107 [Hymenopellis radicata]|nr:hypothetical protein BDZ89DRAFT_1074107 [Hymenopellis radicata]
MTCLPYRPPNHNADGESKVRSPRRRLTSGSTGMDVDEGYAPAVDREEHFFYLQNDAGLVQLSPGSGYASGTEGAMMGGSAVWSQRRVSNESDSAWSGSLESFGVTSSTVDEDPFTASDNEDDAVSRQPAFSEQTWNQSDFQQALDIPSDPYSNASSQYYLQPPMHTEAYSSGRRHSESHVPRRPPRPILHRQSPSDSLIITDMKNLHVGEGFEAQSAMASLPSTSSSSYSHSGYPSPANDDSSDRLSIPIADRTVMRRHSDSAGQWSRQIPGMLHHRHSESVLGSNTYDAVPANRCPIVRGNSSSLSNALQEPEDRASISSGAPSSHWYAPSHMAPAMAPSTVDSSSLGMALDVHGPPSSPSVAWDTQIFAAEVNNSQPNTTGHGHGTQMQGPESGYQYFDVPSTYTTQANSMAPSGTPEHYNLVDGNDLHLHVDTQDLVGNQTLTALSASSQSYDGVFFPTPQDSAEYNALNNALGDASLESPPILYVCGQRVPTDSNLLPHVASPSSETALAGPGTIVLRMGCKQTRGTRKHDPGHSRKCARLTSSLAIFAQKCSPHRGYTIKSALVRHTREKHGGGPPPRCPVCGNVYRDQTSVQRHWRNQHGPNPKVGKPRKKLKQR